MSACANFICLATDLDVGKIEKEADISTTVIPARAIRSRRIELSGAISLFSNVDRMRTFQGVQRTRRLSLHAFNCATRFQRSKANEEFGGPTANEAAAPRGLWINLLEPGATARFRPHAREPPRPAAYIRRAGSAGVESGIYLMTEEPPDQPVTMFTMARKRIVVRRLGRRVDLSSRAGLREDRRRRPLVFGCMECERSWPS